jgi:hypothetical protein
MSSKICTARVQSIKPLEGFVVLVEFTDGKKREINLEPYLRGKVFESIRQNLSDFRAMRIDERMGTMVWENGADIDPDVLYHNLKPAWAEDLLDIHVAQKEAAAAPTISLSELEKEFGI